MSILKGGEDILSKGDETYNAAFLGADLELDGSRRRDISLYHNNEFVLSVERGVTLGLLKLIYSSDPKYTGVLEGVKSRTMEDRPLAVPIVIHSDDRVLDGDEYDLIVQDTAAILRHSLLQQSSVDVNQNSAEKKIGRFVCEFCHLPFISKAKFVRHRKIHTDEKPYSCIYCHSSFSHHSELRKHREEQHMSNKSFKCNHCPKTFSTRGELKGHLWRHTGEKNHKCAICGKMFATKGNLKMHIDKHAGNNKHKCPFCPQIFTSHSSLESHMSKHTGMKSYKCRYCPKTYAQSGQLTSHERLHTGEKPFICQVCGKGFRLNSTRLNHEKRHAGTRPHICNTCGRSFALSEHLKKHLVTHESRERRTVTCPFCNKSIFAGRNMRKHLIRHRELNISEAQAKAISSTLKPERQTNDKEYIEDDQTSSISYVSNKPRQTFSCSQCSDEFRSMRKLLDHLSEVHFQRELTSAERKELRIQHGIQKLHQCRVCTVEFLDYRLFRSHVLSEHPEYGEQVGLRKTSRKSANALHKCPNCTFHFSLRSDLDEHILKDHLTTVVDTGLRNDSTLQFRCWYCQLYFHTPEQVVAHMTNEHASLEMLSKRVESTDGTGENDVSSSGLWACPYCPATLKSEEEYNSHQSQHKLTTIKESSTIASVISAAESAVTSTLSEVASSFLDVLVNSSDHNVESALEASLNSVNSISSDAQHPLSNEVLDNISEIDRKTNVVSTTSNSIKSEKSDFETNIQLTDSNLPSSTCDIDVKLACDLIDFSKERVAGIESATDLNEKREMAVIAQSSQTDNIATDRSLSDDYLKKLKKKKSKKKKNKKRLAKQLSQKMSSLLMPCRFCSQVFVDRSELTNHIQLMHIDSDGGTVEQFRCWFCNIVFATPEDSVNHMTNVHDSLENLSRRIEQTSESKNSLQTSEGFEACKAKVIERTNEPTLSMDSVRCEFCTHTFENKEVYALHLLTHEACTDSATMKNLDDMSSGKPSRNMSESGNEPLQGSRIDIGASSRPSLTAIKPLSHRDRENFRRCFENPKAIDDAITQRLNESLSVEKVVKEKQEFLLSQQTNLQLGSRDEKAIVMAQSRSSNDSNTYVLDGASNVSVHMCTHCSRVFCGKKALDVHTLKMHGKEYLQKHTVTRSSTPFMCWFCSCHFDSPELVVDHMVTVHENLDTLSKRVEDAEPSKLVSSPANMMASVNSAIKNNATSNISLAISNDIEKESEKTPLSLKKYIPIPPHETVIPRNIANVEKSHQPPPGFKVSYALAYVPIFVPEKSDTEEEKKEE